MTAGMDIAAIAALAGDPARANMLAVLLDGGAHAAGELAAVAGISAPTASGHLAKLLNSRLVDVSTNGRSRHYRLASSEVARMLESIMVVAGHRRVPERRATPRIDPALRHARTCYDHLAGEIGVALAAALVARRAVNLTDHSATITVAGGKIFEDLGVELGAERASRRLLIRPCLDWSERRPHIAGALGAALLRRALETGWVRRQRGTRALMVETRSASPLAALVNNPW